MFETFYLLHNSAAWFTKYYQWHALQHVLIGYAAIIYSVFASSIASPVGYPGHHIQQQQRTPLIFCLRFDLAGERADILLNLTLVVW